MQVVGRITRGMFFGGFLFAVLWLLIAGPRGGNAGPPGRVVVTYWEKWTGNEGAQMQEIVDDFNNSVGKEKGIYVKYMSVSSVNQKTLMATAAGVPPDVAGVWDGQVPQFAALGAVECLDDLAREYGITEDYYKPCYWEGCSYKGHLYGLISTPWAVALHYNKRLFTENADALRKAGLDPTRPPRTVAEVDRYAEVLDKRDPKSNRLERTGYLPMEPGWFLAYTPFWFGADIYNEKEQRFTLTDPGVIEAYRWIASYSKRLGKDSMTEFRSGLAGFNSPQNPFLVGKLAMLQQGPWMGNYINNLAPTMNRWKLQPGAPLPTKLEERRAHAEWAAAPFPSSVPGLENVTFAGFDVLMIPKGAKHRREAFEFMAYVNRQDVMEKLTSLHCKNSPLRHVSRKYIENHPNPYIGVFETMTSGPNAHPVPPIPIWPEVNEELNTVAQKVYLLTDTPENALAEAQDRLQAKLDTFLARQAMRRGEAQR